MKRTINTFLLSMLTAAAVTFSACGEWTEPESLGLKYPSLEEQNPELYQQYLQALRAYKQTPHAVTIFAMPASDKTPGQRNEHFTKVPDSVDFICLTNPVKLHPTLVAEMEQVREKGTRMLYAISYDELEARWEKILEEEQLPLPEMLEEGDQPEETPESRFLAFCKEQTELQLAYFDQYGLDGIVFSYSGRNTIVMRPDELAAYTARQRAFFDCVKSWREANPTAAFIFEGGPQNLLDKSLLADCAYIVLPLLSATSGDELSLAVLTTQAEGVPNDRFVVGVMAPSATDPSDERGYFNSFDSDKKTPLRAVKGAAQWVVLPAGGYTKAGVAISNAPHDYYNITLVYKNIREAIGIMNPTPKN